MKDDRRRGPDRRAGAPAEVTTRQLLELIRTDWLALGEAKAGSEDYLALMIKIRNTSDVFNARLKQTWLLEASRFHRRSTDPKP